MKAVHINAYGGPEVVEVKSDVQKPTAGANHVLVEVHAASINPIDWKIRAGYLKQMTSLPLTLGSDLSGIVVEKGEGVTELNIGDVVYGQAIILGGGSGSFAEFAAAKTTALARKPKDVDHQQAAALPLAGVSALQALEDHIKLAKNQKILIHGGAGGIGSLAIQLAASIGAFVATTVSGDDKDYVKQLGANQTIDYKQEAFETLLHDYDAVFDTVGGETTIKSFLVLKKGGILVSMLGQPDQEQAQNYGVTAVGQSTGTNTDRLVRLARYVDSGTIKVQIDKVFPIDQAKDAFIHQETNHPRGKVVLKIKK